MTRDEEIGRAAFNEMEFDDADYCAPFEHQPKSVRDECARVGLAAVSRAREIDTCDSCIHYSFGDESDGYYKWCNLHKETTDMIGGCGCNRHQPKEGS